MLVTNRTSLTKIYPEKSEEKQQLDETEQKKSNIKHQDSRDPMNTSIHIYRSKDKIKEIVTPLQSNISINRKSKN